MNVELVRAVLLAWPPVLVGLFWAVGPRRAVLVGVIGGFLFLPIDPVRPIVFGFPVPVNKWNATGLGLALGALLFGRREVRLARPSWLDLPMAGYYLAPLAGLATGVPEAAADTLDVLIGRGLGWVVPYAAGRVYFSRPDGPREVAVALVVGGAAYIPVCLYETAAGPPHYLATLLYGIPASFNSDRLGGWRPSGFLGDGLVVAAWMALTAVTATWLWLGGAWRRGLGAGLAVPLVLTTLACRGVYGYLLLAGGLAVAVAARLLPARAWLVVLVALPVWYMGLRLAGVWDAQVLVRGADFTGRAGTVGWRLAAEDEVIGRVLGERPVVGFGTYIWHAGISRWPDGAWLHALWMGGLVGLALWAAALAVVPAAAGLSRAAGPVAGGSAYAPRWALVCWCSLQFLDGMHNACYIPPTALIAGTLIRSRRSGLPTLSLGQMLDDPGRRRGQ